MPKSRRRKKHERHKPQSRQPHPLQITQAITFPIDLRVYNIDNLSDAERQIARHPRRFNCFCGSMNSLNLLLWRNANRTPYMALFCNQCLTQMLANTAERRAEISIEIEMRIDCEAFEMAAEEAEVCR